MLVTAASFVNGGLLLNDAVHADEAMSPVIPATWRSNQMMAQ